MNFLTLVGLLLVVNTLAFAVWLHLQDKLGAVGLVLSAFAIVAGLALVYNQRDVEASFGKDGAKIHAAAEQVATDAKEIAAIRKRVEAQAETIDIVAKASAEARKLVEKLEQDAERESDKVTELSDQSKAVDEKLKLLVQKTKDIIELPDGRVSNGAIVYGVATKMFDRFDALQNARREKRTAEAHVLAEEVLKLYEDTEAQIRRMGAVFGSSTALPDSDVVRIYGAATDAAFFRGDHEVAIARYSKAYALAPNDPEVTANFAELLLKSKKREAADEILNEAHAHGGDFWQKVRAILIERKLAVPRPLSDSR